MGSTFFFAFVLFVLVAPLYKGGNRALPLLGLELAAIAFLFVVALRQRGRNAQPPLPRTMTAAIALLLVYPLLQLVPLPFALWRALPGHATYAGVLDGYGTEIAGVASRAISLVPASTEYGWLALLPPLAALLATRALEPSRIVLLLTAMSVFAGLESVLGLLQVAAGGESIFYLGNTGARGTPTGTFVSRNHFAAMLAMALPVIIGLIVYGVRRGRRGGTRRNLADANLLSQRALLFASAVVILIALLFSASRAGIATALLGLASSALLIVPSQGSRGRVKWMIGALIVLGVVLAGMIGLAPTLDRFEPDALKLGGEGRFALYAATLRAGVDFLPFGSGLSTFASVFPRYQAGAFGGYIDFAHNDYLQAFMEMGFAGAAIALLLLAAWAMRMTALLRQGNLRSFAVLQVAAGVALLPMIVHSLFDFALHMPGNAVWYAALAGVMLHPGIVETVRVAPLEGGETR